MDQGQPRPPYNCPHEHQVLCNRNRTPSLLRQKLLLWKNRAIFWETCEGVLQVRNKSDVQEGCYLQVQLPEKQSQVLVLFNSQERLDIKIESEIGKTCEKDTGEFKVYLPLVILHLDRLDWFDRMLRFTGQLDNTLYVHKTGILGDGSHGTTTLGIEEC